MEKSPPHHDTMEINDIVKLKHQIRITGYRPEMEAFNVVIKTGGEDEKAFHMDVFPIYISNLGIYPKNFVIPGNHLPINHPDFFDYVDVENKIVERDGKVYKLSFDKDFPYTGKYYLLDDSVHECYALTMTQQQKDEAYSKFVDKTYEGDIILGNVVGLYLKSNKSDNIRVVKRVNDGMAGVLKSSAGYAIVQDPVTYFEFIINVKYLTYA